MPIRIVTRKNLIPALSSTDKFDTTSFPITVEEPKANAAKRANKAPLCHRLIAPTSKVKPKASIYAAMMATPARR